MDYMEFLPNLPGTLLAVVLGGVLVKTVFFDRPAHKKYLERRLEEKMRMASEVLSDRFTLQERPIARMAYLKNYGPRGIDDDLIKGIGEDIGIPESRIGKITDYFSPTKKDD
jgi:hypothetical protein